MTSGADRIDAELKRLHGTDAAEHLSRLHLDAAALIDESDARRFHLTHAWVFALEAGNGALLDAIRPHFEALGVVVDGTMDRLP